MNGGNDDDVWQSRRRCYLFIPPGRDPFGFAGTVVGSGIGSTLMIRSAVACCDLL